MKSSLLFITLICLCVPGSYGQFPNFGLPLPNIIGNIVKDPCERDLLPKFKDIFYEFTVRITKSAAKHYNDRNFVISPFTMWLSMASIAEFSELPVKEELFNALLLPKEACVREKLYKLAENLEIPGSDVPLQRNRILAIDEQADLNPQWTQFTNDILPYRPVPLDLESFAEAQAVMGVPSKNTFEGNSFFLDRLDWTGFWTSAFSDGIIERGPFTDGQKHVSTIEYMKMKRRVKLAHIPIIDAKVIELPIGNDGRYSMLFTMGVKNQLVSNILEFLKSSVVVQTLSALTISMVPIDVAIPVFSLTSGLDARPLLEEVGLGKVFTDPAASRYLSKPPALPYGYLQRISVNITSTSLRSEEPSFPLFGVAANAASSMLSVIGRHFIADRPFIFSLIDTKTKVTLFTGVYSYPEHVSYRKFSCISHRT